MTRAFVFLGLFGVLAVLMAFINLRAAQQRHDAADWPWARHHLVISNIWSAAATLIGAIAAGAFI